MRAVHWEGYSADPMAAQRAACLAVQMVVRLVPQ